MGGALAIPGGRSSVFSLQEQSCLAKPALMENTVGARIDTGNPEPWHKCIFIRLTLVTQVLMLLLEFSQSGPTGPT